MGIGRTIYGVWGAKIKIYPYMFFCASLCVLCYLGISVVRNPVIQLASCALTGFSVSIMWPATFSLSSARFPRGGPALFAVLALMGDMGCSSGPWIVGLVSNASGLLENGIFACIAFPAVFLLAAAVMKGRKFS
jgi:fucose permease